MNIEQMLERPNWEIALSLNEGELASRTDIRESFEKRKDELKKGLGEERFKKIAGIIGYVNSMMLDFEYSLDYTLIEENKKSLVELQENSMLYGRSSVVKKLDEYGRKNNMSELIINSQDMQSFLVYHALPHFRLCRPDKEEVFYMDKNIYTDLMSMIKIDEKNSLKKALTILDKTNNENYARKYLFAKLLGDKKKEKEYGIQMYKRATAPRESIDRLLNERALLIEQCSIKRLQEGDYNRLFPLASHIYLVDGDLEKKVWKENVKLFTDFSRFDGYNAEKEILQELNHPNIIKLLGTFKEKDFEFMELELAPGISLNKYDKFERWESLEIGLVVCDIFEYLHSKDILYMDLKDTNLMYNRGKSLESNSVRDNLKLLDFGMSQKVKGLNDESVITTLMSTPRYVTPETTAFRAYKSTDTFQLGVLLYELLFQKHPFGSEDIEYQKGNEFRESELIQYGLAVKYGDYKPVNDNLNDLLSQMMNKDPAKRPDLVYVKNQLENEYKRFKPTQLEEVKEWNKLDELYILDDSRYCTTGI